MASIILKWLRRCIFICFCAVFLMSHNASAIELSRDVDLIQGNFQGQINVFAVPSGQNSNVSQCNLSVGSWTNALFLGGDCGVNGMAVSIPQRSYNVGDWIVVNLNTSYPRLSASNHMVYYGAHYSGSNGVDLVQQDVSDLNTNTGQITLYFRVYRSFYDNALNISGRSQILNANTTDSTVILRVNSVSVYHEKDNTDYTSILNEIKDNTAKTPSAEDNANAISDKQETATQDAADGAADSGDQSVADAENATAGLISVIGGFVNAITSASPSDCKINGKINNSFNMGELDLCSMPVPPFVQIISSLILIAICIPFAIIMFNRFVGLFRSFQG